MYEKQLRQNHNRDIFHLFTVIYVTLANLTLQAEGNVS